MQNKGMNLAWIVADDFDQTLKFYTEVIGLKLLSRSEDFEWAELQGEGGAMLGLSGKSDECPLKPGMNSILTYSVENIEESEKNLKEKGVELMGDIQEVPGHVKLLLFKDVSGNMGQLVELIEK